MNNKFVNWYILLVLALIWGSSFILMKRGLETFTSGQVAALRIFIAFLFLLPITFKHAKKALLLHWKAFLAMGVLGNLIPAFLFTEAETGISSSLTGMLNSLTPLFTLLFGVLLFKTKVTKLNVLGILIGFIGAIGLLTLGRTEHSDSNYLYSLYVVLATMCYAFSINIIKKYLGNIDSISATACAMLFIGPMAGVYLFTTDFTHRLMVEPNAAKSIGYISLLGIFGTAISVVIFNTLIKKTGALFASSVTYLIPIVAIGWGFFENEEIGLMHFAWITIILSGIYLVNKKPRSENL